MVPLRVNECDPSGTGGATSECRLHRRLQASPRTTLEARVERRPRSVQPSISCNRRHSSPVSAPNASSSSTTCRHTIRAPMLAPRGAFLLAELAVCRRARYSLQPKLRDDELAYGYRLLAARVQPAKNQQQQQQERTPAAGCVDVRSHCQAMGLAVVATLWRRLAAQAATTQAPTRAWRASVASYNVNTRSQQVLTNSRRLFQSPPGDN